MEKFITILLVLCSALATSAQTPFNGYVFDVNGNPIKGARIYTDNSKRYAKSDKEGRFGLTDVQPDDTIHVKVKTQKEPYAIAVEGRKSMKIYLAHENVRGEEDEELISFGYGFVKKRESMEVRSGISGEELERTGETNLLSALRGRIAGLTIATDGTVTLRGTKSLTQKSEPLFVVDGTVVSNFDFVNIHDVDRVEILKEATIYGSRGANGAILVYTKKGKKKK